MTVAGSESDGDDVPRTKVERSFAEFMEDLRNAIKCPLW